MAEVNATFYRLPQESTFSGWLERTPDHFVFAVKTCSSRARAFGCAPREGMRGGMKKRVPAPRGDPPQGDDTLPRSDARAQVQQSPKKGSSASTGLAPYAP
ncbi:MAG: DUF72 domain-containing protein [Planctomycetes bacterium]|nr:DUF72 domain-containing protein [Planctomycetota bacterium]